MYIGVDTHKQQHMLGAVDEQGRTGKTLSIRNTPEGWATALSWSRQWEGEHVWGIENSGSLGKGFAQFLLDQSEPLVYEISPQRTAQYRRRGRTQNKTDELDAQAITRLLVAESEDLPLARADDLSTELRVLSDHRDNLLKERTRLINRLRAQMLQLDPVYDEKSGPLTKDAGIIYCQNLELPDSDSLVQTRMLIIHQLCEQITRLNEEMAEIEKMLQQKVKESQTPLIEMSGIGDVIAARLIGELGCSPRIQSAAALAALAGISPVAVSSGSRCSYRLNRGGNRMLNRAFHMIALGQRRCNPLARAYYAKKLSEGKTDREAMRCLKRQLVNVVYRLLRHKTQGIEDPKTSLERATAA